MELSKRMKASRENAKLGGPKTEKGLTRSSLNSTTHGILARAPLDTINGRKIFEQLRDEFQAHTPSRKILVELLAQTVIRLHRCSHLEMQILKAGAKAPIVEEIHGEDGTVKTIRDPNWPEGMLTKEALENLGLIYERYEPRLVSRMLKLREALMASRKRKKA